MFCEWKIFCIDSRAACVCMWKDMACVGTDASSFLEQRFSAPGESPSGAAPILMRLQSRSPLLSPALNIDTVRLDLVSSGSESMLQGVCAQTLLFNVYCRRCERATAAAVTCSERCHFTGSCHENRKHYSNVTGCIIRWQVRQHT